jgi:tetratricopeptide (TPR) repeat protein
MTRLASLDHLPQALDWQRKVTAAAPTLENQLDLAALGLVDEKAPFPLTTRILTELAPAATNHARYQMVAADLAMSLGRLAEAEEHFETAAELEPTNPMHPLNLALLRLGMHDEAKQNQSRAVLENLGTNEAVGLVALRALVTDRLNARDMAGANRYSTELLARPQAARADRLQNLGILQRLNSGDFTNRLQSVQQAAATNALSVAEVSDWMQAHGLLRENVRWLTGLPARVRARQPVPLALAQGYLQGENWTALRDFTAQGNWDNLEYLRLALVSHALAKLGDFQVAKDNWDAAVNETGRRLEPMTKLWKLANAWQLDREAVDVLQRMVAAFPRERWAQQALVRIYFNTGNTAAMNRLSDRLTGVFPNEIEYKNNLAATALLLHTNLARAGKWAAEVYAKNPDNASVTSTYAFALHVRGRDREGLEVLQKLPPDTLKQPSLALYYGVLLAATGQTNDAAPYLAIAQTQGRLWPEEKQLLAAALKGPAATRPR